jgi:hypothetical protein
MHRRRVPATILAASLSACVVEPELLNSERIESKFGNFGIEIVDQSVAVRRASLYSIRDRIQTCRTFAVVRFQNLPLGEIGDEHAQILAGASIGATFRANGWRIYKETRHIGELDSSSDEHGIRRRMQVDESQALAMHVYRLLLKKEEQIIEYATIIEVHHPDYLTEQQLERLFAVKPPAATRASERRAWTELAVRKRASTH